MIPFLEYDFMVRALVAGVGIALICPLIGSVLLLKKSVMIIDVLSHSALTGVALGLWLRVPPLFTTLVYTTMCSVFVEYFRQFRRLSPETMLSLLFSGNLALAIYLLSVSRSFNNLYQYLFGSVTLMSQMDMILLGCVCVFIFLSLFFFWRVFWQVLIDEKGAKVAGLPVSSIQIFLAILVGAGVTASLTIVGLLLVSALVILPLLIASQVMKSFCKTLILAEGMSIFSTLFGIIGSYYWDIPASALITGVLICLFVLFFFLGNRVRT